MASSYQGFLTGLLTKQVKDLELAKRREIAYGMDSHSRKWADERARELSLIRKELRMRGEQLEIEC